MKYKVDVTYQIDDDKSIRTEVDGVLDVLHRLKKKDPKVFRNAVSVKVERMVEKNG